MEFLKEVLGEELYAQVAEKLNAHNGNEANKDNQIKIGNLGKGEYISKDKYEALNGQLTGKQTELDTANGLIAELKKSNKGNEALQGKITEYEGTVADLQAQLQETKLKSAIKVALLSEKVTDVEYLTYKLESKLKEEGKTLELDENENIKGWDDKLNGLKTQVPTMFETKGEKEGFIPVENKGLPKDFTNATVTKEQFMNMTVDQRIALKQQNEKMYHSLKG